MYLVIIFNSDLFSLIKSVKIIIILWTSIIIHFLLIKIVKIIELK
jgi:hypothetical protein